jgi:DNA polymerase-3 subunit gamma/tau
MSEYRVLARKYRPQTFDDLVGQEVLVRTLSNAIKMGRIAHAFLLTGIRGIGKTTTARIIARALNCIGEDGHGGATISPCGVCANCVQIREDRHPDVLEMDAASRTGVGDIRELIEKVQYAPSIARYKVYIIDEVHMLSNSAFNALLKTLEEPPPQVIFIFATTEIRKIPVTILSRCQRFDLKRLDVDQLSQHLMNICEKESVNAEEAALRLIAMAAEGSVRDGLSLLDRAIAHGLGDGESSTATAVNEDLVRGMLGLADRTRLFALLECLFAGEISDALNLLRQQYRDGLDMALMMQDMLGLVHTITRLCINKNDDLGPSYAHAEKDYALRLASKLSVGTLSRAWQMLMKGLDEVRRAPDALTAAEMVCIRFAFTAELPDPTDLVKKIRDAQTVISTGLSVTGGSGHMGGGAQAMRATGTHGGGHGEFVPQGYAVEDTQAQAVPHLVLAAHNPVLVVATFEDVLDACEQRREAMLQHQLTCDVALVSCQAGELVLSPVVGNGEDVFRRNLNEFLRRVTEKDWAVRFEKQDGLKTLHQQREEQKAQDLAQAAEHPLTKRVMAAFPDAQLVAVKSFS